MTHHSIAIACAAVFVACSSTPVQAMDCVETQLMLTADYGDRYVLSCTEPKPVLACQTKPRDPVVATSSRLPQSTDERTPRGAQAAQVQACDEPLDTTQAAQAR